MRRSWLLLPLAVLASAAYLSTLGPPRKRATPVEPHATEVAAPIAPLEAKALSDEASATIESTADVPLLTRWLHEETARGANGNVVSLVEALGRAGAIDTLIEALDDDRHDLALKTLIVQQLGQFGDLRAARAVADFATLAKNAPIENEFDLELRTEALTAADETGRRLRN